MLARFLDELAGPEPIHQRPLRAEREELVARPAASLSFIGRRHRGHATGRSLHHGVALA